MGLNKTVLAAILAQGSVAQWLNQSSDTTIQFISDSLGAADVRFIRKAVNLLAVKYPEYTWKYSMWDDATNVAYPTLTTISSGTGPHTVTVWNGAIGGTIPTYLFGSKRAAAFANQPDIVIWNHGKNLTSHNYREGRVLSAIEMHKMLWPNAKHVWIKQPPNRDDTNMTAMVRIVEDEVVREGGIAIDLHQSWVDAGKPSAWYTDNLHPSDPVGYDIMANEFVSKFSGTPLHAATPKLLDTKIAKSENLLLNGDFSDWTGALPVSFTAVSSPTATKEATIVDSVYGRTQSLKLTGVTAAGNIRQQLTTPNLEFVKNQYVTLAVRLFVPVGMAQYVGQCSIVATEGGVTSTWNQSFQGTPQGAWTWMIMRSPRAILDTVTILRVIMSCDSQANTDSTVYYDRAILVPGLVPKDVILP